MATIIAQNIRFKALLGCFMLLLCLTANAQVINESTIRQEINTKLASNNTKAISATVHRALMQKVIDFIKLGATGVVSDSLAASGRIPYFITTGNLGNSPFQVGSGRVGLGVSPSYPLDITGDINTSANYRIGGVKFADTDPIYNNIYGKSEAVKIKLGNAGTPTTYFFNSSFQFMQNDLSTRIASLYTSRFDIGDPLTTTYANAALKIGGSATTRGIQIDAGSNNTNRTLIQNNSGVLEQYSNDSKLSGISRANKIVTSSIGGNLTDTSAALSFFGYDAAVPGVYQQARILSRRAGAIGDYYGILDFGVSSDGDPPYTLLSLNGNSLFTTVEEKLRVKKDAYLATLLGTGLVVGDAIYSGYKLDVAGWARINSNTFLATEGGSVGIRTVAPTSSLDVDGVDGYNQIRARKSATPSSTAASDGQTGNIVWDNNYIYLKTSAGWKRAALSTF